MNDKIDLFGLTTEGQNARSQDLDLLPVEDMLTLINDEDASVAGAVRKEIAQIAKVVEKAAAAVDTGGCLHLFGAGTSGRLAVLDASECRPTFGVESSLVQGHIAGGLTALVNAIEGAEDDPKHGAAHVVEAEITSRDVVVAITASGRTPYCLGVLKEATSRGAFTAAVTCNTGTPCHEHAAVTIAPVVGPEVLSGSTRMKAGTAQKMVLNMISTGTMIRCRRTYGNLMVALRANSEKLKSRARHLVTLVTGSDEGVDALLESAGWDVRVACVMRLAKVDREEAESRLERHQGSLRAALGD